jgi:hypothetical protein
MVAVVNLMLCETSPEHDLPAVDHTKAMRSRTTDPPSRDDDRQSTIQFGERHNFRSGIRNQTEITISAMDVRQAFLAECSGGSGHRH